MEFVWGIDVAVSRLAFAFADLESGHVAVETVLTRNEEREGARLGLIDRQLRLYGRQAAGRYPPACVWVEQASGKFIKPQLHYVVGVIQAALFETLACPVWTITSGAWKKRTVGMGNATKPQVQAWVDALGLSFRDEHQADAIAIAAAGRAMFSARSWEASAA